MKSVCSPVARAFITKTTTTNVPAVKMFRIIIPSVIPTGHDMTKIESAMQNCLRLLLS